MNDEELGALVDTFAEREEEGLAGQNLYKYGTTNGDKAAKGYKMADRLGELPPATEESYAAMERRYAQSLGVNYFGSPMVRRMLADERLARLVADSPQEWERASLWEKTMDAITSGRLRRDETLGAIQLTAPEETPDAGSLLVGDEADAAALAALDTDFTKIAERAMQVSPNALFSSAFQGMQEHAREVEENRVYGAAQIAEARLQQGLLTSPDLSSVTEAETLGEAVGEVLSNPFAAIAYPALQSLSSTAEETAAAGALSVLNPMLGAMAIGSGSYQQEYTNTFLSTLEEEGVDVTDYEAIARAYQDPGIRHRAEQRAMGRALVVASADTLAGVAASFTMKPVSKAMALRRMKRSKLAEATTDAAEDIGATAGVTAEGGKAVMRNLSGRAREFIRAMQSNDFVVNAAAAQSENLAWQTLIGGALGAGGEAAGQLAIGEEVNLGDMVLEAFADAFTAPVDVLTMRSEVIQQAAVDRVKAMQAHDVATAIEATAALQDQSVLNQRDPNAFADTIQSKVADTKFGEVSFSAQEVKGFAQELVQASPTIAAQWQEAEVTGGDIVIPFAELFRIRAQNPQAFTQLAQRVRTDGEGMSLQEATEYDQNNGTNLQAKVERLAETTGKATVQKQRDGLATYRALEPLRKQLRAAGVSRQETDTALAIESAILENLASMAGMTVEEWMAENPLFVQRVNTNGEYAGFNQVSGEQERRNREVNKQGLKARRGNFDPNTRTITLFKAANESTFIHEAAHYWLDAMVRHAIATGGILPEPVVRDEEGRIVRPKDEDGDTIPVPNQAGRKLNQLLADFFTWIDAPGMKEGGLQEALKRWQEGGEEVQRDAQEKFARGFEAYMLNGKPPVESLKGLFKQFVRWLKRIYVNAAGLGVDMSPEVIDLYDRLFVSEQAVIDAKARMGDVGVFDDLVKTQMTEDEFRDFVDLRDNAREDSEAWVRAAKKRDALLARSRQLREQKGLQREYEALIEEEKEKFFATEQFRALHSLTDRGIKGADGKIQRFKFAKETMDTAVEDGRISAKNAEWVKRRGMVSRTKSSTKPGKNTQRIEPEYLAQLFGFESVDAMVDAMRDAYTAPIDAWAEELAAQRFLEMHGEAPDADGIGKLAAVAVQDAASLDVLATEAVALRKAMGGQRELRDAIVAFAKQAITRLPIRGLSAGKYRAAATRAGDRSFKAFTKGDTQGAAEAKQAQLIQTALAKEVDATRLRIERFNDRVRRALKSKTILGEYSAQIHKLAYEMGFAAAKPYTKSPKIDAFVNGAKGVSPNIDIKSAYDAMPESMFSGGELIVRPLSELTVAEFNALDNLFRTLEAAGRGEMKSRESENRGTIAAFLDKAKVTIEENSKAVNRGVVQEDSGHRPMQDAARFIRGFFMKHISFTRFIQTLDGNKQGFLTRTIVWAANACGDRETTLQKKYGEMLHEAVTPLLDNLNKDIVEYKGKRYTKQMVASAILNFGNEGNRNRLEHNGLKESDIVALARKLSEDEIKSIQKIWDIFEEVRKLAAEKERRVNGFEPEWADPLPFTLISREGKEVRLKGGYCPIVYDPNLSNSAAFHELQDALEAEKAAGYTAAQTQRTYTKARAEKVNPDLKLRLDLKGVADGLNEVIHDVCWAEYVSNFNRIWRGVTTGSGTDAVKHDGLGDLVFKYFGKAGADIGREWIKAIALNGSSIADPTSAIAAKIRHGVSIAGLGFNIVSALVQTTGLIAASSRLGPAGVMGGLAEFVSNPRDNIAGVNAASEFMRNRTNTRNREIYEVQNVLTGTPSKMADFERMAYAMMMKVQSIVDYATWNAAYRKGIADGLSETDAAKFADQEVINTQGSGMIKDRSQIENMNGWGQLWLSFYAFMGTAYNLGAMSLMGEADMKRKVAQLSTLFFVMPIIEALMRDALKIDGDDDDEEEKTAGDWMRFAVANSVGFTLGTMIGAREISSVVQNVIEGKPVWGWRGPSGGRIFSDISSFAQQLGQGELDEGFARAALNLGGSTIGIPSAQLWRLWTGIDAYFIEDVTDNPLVLGVGYSGDR